MIQKNILRSIDVAVPDSLALLISTNQEGVELVVIVADLQPFHGFAMGTMTYLIKE